MLEHRRQLEARICIAAPRPRPRRWLASAPRAARDVPVALSVTEVVVRNSGGSPLHGIGASACWHPLLSPRQDAQADGGAGVVMGLSDLHVRHKRNRAAVERRLADPRPGRRGRAVGPRHARPSLRAAVVGPDHELWIPARGCEISGARRCLPRAGHPRAGRPLGTWSGPRPPRRRASTTGFRPVAKRRRAGETGVICTDEFHLKPTPYPSGSLVHRPGRGNERRLDALPRASNHRGTGCCYDLVRLPRIPRTCLSCGTKA